MTNHFITQTIPRSIALPVVFAFSLLAFLLGVVVLNVQPWFARSFDWLDSHGVGHADVDVVFRRFGSIGAALLIAAPALAGLWLLRRREARTAHVAWFSALSAIGLTGWVLWLGLVFHNTYIALFTH